MFKQILLWFIALSFAILALYLGMLTYYGIWIYRDFRQHRWQSLASHAQTVSNLTDWATHTRSVPFFLMMHDAGDILATLGLALAAGQQVSHAIIANQPDGLGQDWGQLEATTVTLLDKIDSLGSKPYLRTVEWAMQLSNQEQHWIQFKAFLDQITQNQALIKTVLAQIPEGIGLSGDQEKVYTILLQNHRELRPTGGFLGSYAQLKFLNGGLARMEIQDIYVPDGALNGHVAPPAPIQQAFKQGWWKLRDSNWDPDFPTAVKQMSWFFEKGDVRVGDGVMALNLNVMEEVLTQLGDLSLPDYTESITAESLYQITQYETERAFFPGSTQKKDFLQQLMKTIVFKLESLEATQALSLLSLMSSYLNSHDIQVWFADTDLQALAQTNHWSGELQKSSPGVDYTLIVDANLGANKANCCVDRQVKQIIEDQSDHYRVDLTITYTNQSPTQRPKPPKFWGGDYENYLRIFLPISAQDTSIHLDDQVVKGTSASHRSWRNLQSIGFFVIVPHAQKRTVTLTYVLPKIPSQLGYQLYIQKQSGIRYWHEVEYRSHQGTLNTKRWIDQDQLVHL